MRSSQLPQSRLAPRRGRERFLLAWYDFVSSPNAANKRSDLQLLWQLLCFAQTNSARVRSEDCAIRRRPRVSSEVPRSFMRAMAIAEALSISPPKDLASIAQAASAR